DGSTLVWLVTPTASVALRRAEVIPRRTEALAPPAAARTSRAAVTATRSFLLSIRYLPSVARLPPGYRRPRPVALRPRLPAGLPFRQPVHRPAGPRRYMTREVRPGPGPAWRRPPSRSRRCWPR